MRYALLILLAVAAGCAAPRPERRTDPEAAAAARRGQKAFGAGRYEAAAGAYRAALGRARMLNDRAGIGDSAYNLAACLAALGEYRPAREALREAAPEFEPDSRSLAEALLLEAGIARQQGLRDEALALADRALQLRLRRAETSAVAAQAHLLRALLYCDAKAAGPARTALAAAAARLADLPADAPQRTGAKSAEGRVLLVENRPAEAAARFDQAAADYEKAGRPRDVAESLAWAAAGLEAAGDFAGAADRRYRAARSLCAQKAFARALQQIDAALAAARKAGCPELEQRIGALFDEVHSAVGAAEAEQKPAPERKKEEP